MVFFNSSLYLAGLFLLDMCAFPFCFFLSLILTHLSTFLVYIQTTIGQEEAWVNRLRSAPDTLGITCYVDGEDAGNCEISFRGDMKVSHRATIANAILKDYWNLGIGSAMFEELVSAAQNRGTEIMELEFIEGNDRARHLYEKFGFRVVCERPNMFKLKDGTYRSEFYMQKYL